MKKLIAIMAIAGMTSSLALAQAPTQSKDAGQPNVFTTVKDARITSIKNQANSGTCWAYSGQSFLEDELIRIGKGEYDLSEMFVVSHSYRDKGRKYVRLHGKLNFAQGGSFYDVLYVLKEYGAVPQSVLPGLNYGTTKNQHGEWKLHSRASLTLSSAILMVSSLQHGTPPLSLSSTSTSVSFPKASRSMARSTRLRAMLRKWV